MLRYFAIVIVSVSANTVFWFMASFVILYVGECVMTSILLHVVNSIHGCGSVLDEIKSSIGLIVMPFAVGLACLRVPGMPTSSTASRC